MSTLAPKILLVDDREDNLLSLEIILKPRGYQFVRANSGKEALKILLTEFDFALILMDVNMPNLNGFETATFIYEREKLKRIPIIFITANNYGDENMFKGYQVGGIDFIQKPIQPEVLNAKVGLLVDLYIKNNQLLEQEEKLIAVNRILQIEISERRASDEKVQQINGRLLENLARLEIANNDLGRFAFMASHDLQEPLRKIRVFSSKLNEKYKGVDQGDSETVSRIDKAAERMQILVDSILALTKISSGTTAFEKCNLNPLLEEIRTDMEEEIKEKEVTLTIEPLPPLFVNRDLMRQLFQNLISNSIKYRKKDSNSVIKIYAEIDSSDIKITVGTDCFIFVEDNGIGFDQKYSNEIFGMLSKLHGSQYEGAGIGLAICRKIVDVHHGFISARSKLGQGATFVISLPLYKGEAA
ncbi:MAG TPA: response regulator [Cyclobacteriaceae bacterium]|jgi:signal transduction histidine kinase|nr:response regulator [Cyclobacteriaceae bacterium]